MVSAAFDLLPRLQPIQNETVAAPAVGENKPKLGVYGYLRGSDVFNQLVMLETPALLSAPILSKL